MKRFAFAVAAVLLTSGLAFAATAPKGPKVLEAKQGNVTFDHANHAAVKCDVCHGEGEPKAMGKMEKDVAHKMCQGCHKEQKKGPQKCADCHKKA